MECILFIFLISFILAIPPGDTATQKQMVCPNKFQPIGRFCYHFSDETKNWKGARKACKKMGDISSNLNVMLATMDVTGVPQDNQDLLSAIRDNNYKYWLGGQLKGEGDKARWRWLDNRPIHLKANYWRENSPNNTEGHECLSVSTHSKDADSKKLHTRASVIDKDCSKKYRYVCQAACPKGFQLIGKYCYFFSSENKVSGVTWDDARKFCQGKSADLAVMGLDTFNDQKMLDIIANAGKNVYMGASDRTKDNSWFWLDGRPIPLNSYFWAGSAPQSSATHDVLIAKVISSPSGEEKAVVEDATSTVERHFVCQLLYTPPFGQMYIPVQQMPGQLNSVPATAQLLNPKGQMVPSQLAPSQQAGTWPPGTWHPVYPPGVMQPVYPPAPYIQSVQAPGSGPMREGLPGVWPRPEAWHSDFTPNGIVEAGPSVPKYGQVEAVHIVQTPQGVPVVSTPADSKVEDHLLQLILDAEKEREEKAASVGKKKVVKKDTNDAYDSKDSYHTYDTYDSYDSYDTENTDFSHL